MGPATSRHELLEKLTPAPNKPVGAPELVASQIRSLILSGELTPGSRLDEERLRTRFRCSRSTLREAFRLLAQHRLIEHHLSRGVFVSELGVDDLLDLFASRRLLECSVIEAVARHGELDTEPLRRMGLLMQVAREAASQEDWADVMRADLLFHTHLVALARSRRVAAFGVTIMAESQLAGTLMANRNYARPRMQANAGILDCLLRRDFARARGILDNSLREAERSLRAPAFPALTRRYAS